MRRFLWAGSSDDRKINWVAWDIITKSKKAGGLGVNKLQDVNDALLLKWAWRFKKEDHILWKKVVMGCHGSSRIWTMLPCTSSASGCWKQIVKLGEKKLWNGRSHKSYFFGVLGDGSTINFWADSWLRDEPLRLTYPHLFRLEKNKWVKVASRLQVVNDTKVLTWDWRSNPGSYDEVNELFQLLEDIYNYSWKGGIDKWLWKSDAQGVFSVSKAKHLISHDPQPFLSQMKWKGWVPLKCKIMVWRAIINRLPSRVELIRRGVVLPCDSCVLCNSDSETILHLFTGCLFSAEVGSRIGYWCRLEPIFAFDVSVLLKMVNIPLKSKYMKYVLRGIIFTTMWELWNERNTRIFKGKRRRAMEVVESIKSTSFFWIRNRSRFKGLKWLVWCKFPLDQM